MKKEVLLQSIQRCVEACEDLATACTTSSAKLKICGDCLNSAIDCADGGMILIMKLSAEDNELHRNLINQFVKYCKACISSCAMHDANEHVHNAIDNCQKSIAACKRYVDEHIHTDQYYYVPKITSAYAMTQRRFRHSLGIR